VSVKASNGSDLAFNGRLLILLNFLPLFADLLKKGDSMGKTLLVTLLFLRAVSAARAAVDPSAAVEATARHALVIQARQGDAEAQWHLGSLYVRGEGVPQDDTEAAQWYRRAAEHGHVGAQGSLAMMYSSGLGVPRDIREAAKWYREAAEHGDADSQVIVAAMYYTGTCVPRSKIRAYQWATIAISNPSLSTEDRDGLQEDLDRLTAKMTSTEIAKAEKRVKQWQSKAGDKSQNTQ
jgi:TPR repeat protein